MRRKRCFRKQNLYYSEMTGISYKTSGNLCRPASAIVTRPIRILNTKHTKSA